MELLDKIKKQVKYLPTKDAELANKFIEERNFESLRDLVSSAVYKLEELQYNVNQYVKQFDYEPDNLYEDI